MYGAKQGGRKTRTQGFSKPAGYAGYQTALQTNSTPILYERTLSETAHDNPHNPQNRHSFALRLTPGVAPQAMVGGTGLAGFQNGFSGKVPGNIFRRGSMEDASPNTANLATVLLDGEAHGEGGTNFMNVHKVGRRIAGPISHGVGNRWSARRFRHLSHDPTAPSGRDVPCDKSVTG